MEKFAELALPCHLRLISPVGAAHMLLHNSPPRLLSGIVGDAPLLKSLVQLSNIRGVMSGLLGRRLVWIGNVRRRLVSIPCLMVRRGYMVLEFWRRLGLLLLSIIFFLRLDHRLEWSICCYMGAEVEF